VHPVIVLLAVIGGGQLAGLAGVRLAVSALAVLRVFFDFFRARIRTSSRSEPGTPGASSKPLLDDVIHLLYRHPTVIVSGARLSCSLATIVRLSPGSRSKKLSLKRAASSDVIR
jgi:hypothetical protein